MNKLNINKAKKNILILSRIGLSTLFLPLISSSCKLEKSQLSEYKVKYENRMSEINNNLHQFENNSNSMINVEIQNFKNTMNSMSQDLENLLKTNSENESYELYLDKLNIEYDKFIKTIEKIKNQNTQPENPGTQEPETPTPQPETPDAGTQTPDAGTEDQTSQQNEETKIKWGHWNIYNFTGDRSKQYEKTKRIALLANQEKFDVLGLTEVNKEEGVKTLVDELNQLNNSNFYSYVISKKLKGEKFGDGAAEHIAVIYNNQKMEAEAFNNNEIGHSYTQKFTDEFGDDNAQYSRPPYGVKFKYKLKPETKLTFVFAHFDGPGASKSNKKIGEKSYKGLGSFEYREAKQLATVLDYFDSIDGEQSNIFFGGDTNIKLGKQNLAFSTMQNKYKSVFSDTEEHKTSLGKRKNNYSEPYDKMFYKTNYKLVSFQKFDLYKVKTDEKVKALLKKHNVGLEAKEKASTISDHTYISAEFLIK
ncbi:MnuA family membrane nuclease [Mycoplasmopsis arginini]|uniref:MnuA family membrane nuclease n=1 Tax=Mycoplasmopsis arginini TaxID=2094 RepID=UPI003519D31A